MRFMNYVEDNTVAPHSLRRSYATWLDEKGVKISRISKLLGHAKESHNSLFVYCR